jgi:hypothetical protein
MVNSEEFLQQIYDAIDEVSHKPMLLQPGSTIYGVTLNKNYPTWLNQLVLKPLSTQSRRR